MTFDEKIYYEPRKLWHFRQFLDTRSQNTTRGDWKKHIFNVSAVGVALKALKTYIILHIKKYYCGIKKKTNIWKDASVKQNIPYINALCKLQ